ncbi:pentatricopeptide repeat protein [Ophiostoma piceae UAMH 11346]|uniref:Pentatricopeptide repeat protein n=1 Tax=Ophiostoma piceae (strain UAMH 11346) TaxID=1262450 RepID=S3CIH1_OPHP1|nr:pentatricopeptide repeat protein [Ophiostoma piceae UAMH 11346]
MFVCRACVKRWRGPAPQLLFAGRHAAVARVPTAPSTAVLTTSRRARTVTTFTAARANIPKDTGETPLSLDERLRSFSAQEPDALEGSVAGGAEGEEGVEEKWRKDVMSKDELSAEMSLKDDEYLDRLDMLESGQKNMKQMEARVRRRYKFLNDEYTIAETVTQMLDSERYDEALYLTRLASKDFEVPVSWNHLIKFLFRQGRTNSAVKLYHEMKKRGQTPNVRTYTTIFTGCAQTVDKSPEQALLVATKIYYGMLSDARLRPNTIHMNSVLSVCARAKDIQAVFNIAKTANTNTRMPDCTTYTTILSAMRAATESPYDTKGYKTESEKNKYKQNKYKRQKDIEDIGDPTLEKPFITIRRARATWEEVVLNWRRGFLLMDERLVCSMGRILLLGSVADNSSILALLHQTMGIPRLDKGVNGTPSAERTKLLAKPAAQVGESGSHPELASPQEQTGAPAKSAADEAAIEQISAGSDTVQIEPNLGRPAHTEDGADLLTAALQSQNSQADAGIEVFKKAELRPKQVAQFTAIDPYDDEHYYKAFVPKSSDVSLLQPKPSHNTLSLLLAAIGGSRKTTLALPYWKLMTSSDKYCIVPDIENCHQLLRTIKRGRSSTEAVEALLILPKFAYIGKTFKLAMEVCTYNTLNPNAFKSAGKIVDLMNQTAIMPDASTLRLYLKVALTSNQHFKEAKTPEEAAVKKEEFGKQIVRALQRLWDPVRILGNGIQAMEKAAASTTNIVHEDKHAPTPKSMQLEYIDLLKLMVSAADMVVSEKMADEATIKDMSISRNLLNRQVTRYYEGRSPLAPTHPDKKRRLGAPYVKRKWTQEEVDRSISRNWVPKTE